MKKILLITMVIISVIAFCKPNMIEVIDYYLGSVSQYDPLVYIGSDLSIIAIPIIRNFIDSEYFSGGYAQERFENEVFTNDSGGAFLFLVNISNKTLTIYVKDFYIDGHKCKSFYNMNTQSHYDSIKLYSGDSTTIIAVGNYEVMYPEVKYKGNSMKSTDSSLYLMIMKYYYNWKD